MILIISDDGRYRLTTENKWSDFVPFGNVPGCVKLYSRLGMARRMAERVHGLVVKVPDGMSVDASGLVLETTPDPNNPGYEIHKHHQLMDFVVK